MEAHPVAAFTGLEAELDKALAASGELWQCIDSEITGLTVRSQAILSKIHALQARLISEADTRGIPKDEKEVSTANWVRDLLLEEPAAAKRIARLAEESRGTHRAVVEELAAGRINRAQAYAILDALRPLPTDLDTETVEVCRTTMLEAAQRLNAKDLRELGRAVRNAADPDGSEPEDEKVAKLRNAGFRIHGDGSETMTWRDSTENIAHAKALLATLDGPKPADDGTRDPRTGPQRRADALALVFSQTLRHGENEKSRGVVPHLHLTVGLECLRNEPGSPLAALATGSALTREAVRRLACDCDITPIVLDEKGVPLSVGRTYRTVTAGIWAALVARDGGCVFPGCTAPAWMCEAHHLRHWEDGGPTELENLALLCDRHHRTVHNKGWDIRLGEDRHPELIPPAWIAAGREPRRNDYWRIQRELLKPPPHDRQ